MLLIRRYKGDEGTTNEPSWQYTTAVKRSTKASVVKGNCKGESENCGSVSNAPGELFQTVPSRGGCLGNRSRII